MEYSMLVIGSYVMVKWTILHDLFIKTKLKTFRLEYDDALKHDILAFLKQCDIDYKISS